jgi:hypothetical protein
MPPLNTAAGDLLIVDFPAMANTIERSACPGRTATPGDVRVRDVATGN